VARITVGFVVEGGVRESNVCPAACHCRQSSRREIPGRGIIAIWRAYEIVGLVADTKDFAMGEDFLPIAYVPIAQITDPRPFTDLRDSLDTAPR
jgi:hypothetical protein